MTRPRRLKPSAQHADRIQCDPQLPLRLGGKNPHHRVGRQSFVGKPSDHGRQHLRTRGKARCRSRPAAGNSQLSTAAAPTRIMSSMPSQASQRTLVTPGSRFDRWLAGDAAALSAQEQDGYRLFKSLGCVSCHQGVNIGGNLFQRHGIFHPLASPKPEILRVPSLRNVASHAALFS